MKDRTRKVVTGIAAVCLIAYGGHQGWLWWLRNEPVDRAAHNMLRAFNERDLNSLWYYSDVGEKDAFHLTPREFERVFQQYIWASVSDLKPTRTVKKMSPHRDTFIMIQFYSVGGREIKLDFVVFKTPDGPKANLITPGVFLVFDRKYGGRHADVSGSNRWWRTRYDGAVGERSRLEALGVTGTKDNAPGRRMVPWEEDMRILKPYTMEGNDASGEISSVKSREAPATVR